MLIVYEWNSHPDTKPEEMLTMLDIISLLEDGVTTGKGKDATVEMSAFQHRALQRVRDPRLKQWFHAYLAWPRDTRAEAVGPVHSRIGAYAANKRAAVIMGQRKSTIVLSDVLSEGLVLLVSTAQGAVGKGPAALMGGTIVSLVESALRDQESLAPSERARCLLVCDEFQTVTGADWEGMFAEIRKYGCSMMLATQSLARLDTPDRRLKAGVLSNVGVIIGYQMAAEDAHIISAEMDAERVPERFLINLNPHHCCVRINSDTTCYPAFSMKTLPPPDLTRGSQEAVEAVLRGSVDYTVDFAESLKRMDLELQKRLDGGDKMGIVPGADGEGNAGSGVSDFDKADDTNPGKQGRSRDRGRGSGKPDGDSGRSVKPDGDSGRSVKPDGDSPVSGSDSSDFDVSDDSYEPEPEPEPELEHEPEPEPELEPAIAQAPAVSFLEPELAGTQAAALKNLISRGLTPADIQHSQFTPEALSYMADVGDDDPAVRFLLEQNQGRHLGQAYKKANKQAEVRIREAEARMKIEIRKQVEEQKGRIHQQALAEALLTARAEFAREHSGPQDGAPRELAQLRRVSFGD